MMSSAAGIERSAMRLPFASNRLVWTEIAGEEVRSILTDFDNSLPEFWDQFDHARLEVVRAPLPFYADYALVVIEELNGAGRRVAALYAPGDVRPLCRGDATSFEHVNRVAPLQLDADTAAAQITSARGAVALVDARDDAAFRQALQKRGWTPRVLGRVSGLDYSNGRTMVLTLYAGVPA